MLCEGHFIKYKKSKMYIKLIIISLFLDLIIKFFLEET